MEKSQILSEWVNNHKNNGLSQAEMIANYYPQSIGYITDTELWPNVIDSQQADFLVDIVTPKLADWKLNVLEQYSDSVRRSVKFPPNTCFLHSLGCLSTAMSRQFSYTPYMGSDETRPVNLFCVSGQPPSTGKSSVNNAFILPIRIAYESINKNNASQRKRLDEKIQALRKELKSATSDPQRAGIEDELMSAATEMANFPDYVTDVNDSTPEGLEKLISGQGGWGNIISAEAEAINVMLGSVYGDSSKKANNGLFLAMWAGEWVSVQRSGRDGFRGYVKGTCAVLAQPETVDAILEAGKLGRGISERFLLIKEPHMLGSRDHHDFKPVNKALKAQYIDLVNQLVNEAGVNFEFNEQAHAAINDYRNYIERQMADSGKFNDSMIRGTMGKAGEQIQKIACIMWGAQEWSRDGRKRKVIGYKTTVRAIEIFDELSRTYLQAAENSGFAGLAPKVEVVKKHLIGRLQKDLKAQKIPKVTVQQLQQNMKSNKAFASTGGLTNYLREVIMPAMVEAKIVMLCRGEYYINPKIGEE